MLKITENPPILYPEVSSIRELGGKLWIAHTRSRNEKALAWDLLNQNASYFLPLVGRTIFSGGRRRQSLMPLFSSYVFLIGDDRVRELALATHRVCNVIAVEDQDKLLDELASIERLVRAGMQIDPCPFAVVGQLVRISRGPFRGVVGRIIRRDNVMRLVVGVSMLNQGAEMEVDADILEPME
ncbi:MAG TPA: transcription termination/antitermination NusG family protein [Tepidisphaeraceae bacterium]|nr:transcription termination/antitermination NusG family protein [Tepidisphaeraceae bacterium]